MLALSPREGLTPRVKKKTPKNKNKKKNKQKQLPPKTPKPKKTQKTQNQNQKQKQKQKKHVIKKNLWIKMQFKFSYTHILSMFLICIR